MQQGIAGSILTCALTLATVWAPVPASAAAGHWTLVAWSEAGVHPMDADFSVFSMLPPSNTIYAQLIDNKGRLVRDPGPIRVTYEALADGNGSINTTSRGKINFWEYAADLFDLATPLPGDAGLGDSAMPGPDNTPQLMRFAAARAWFVAAGIPITPFDDDGRRNPYPLMRVTARDGSGTVLASTDVALPVSDALDCLSCHASNSVAAARPAGGWVNDPDPQKDMRLNILRMHDEREGFRPSFKDALAAAGYDAAGLFTTATDGGIPVLCARCHSSAAIPGSGLAGISPMSQAIHRRMAFVADPASGRLLDDIEDSSACLLCHPGPARRYMRGAMGAAVTADGRPATECQDCHGSMSALAAPARSAWLDEPLCQSCHTGTAVRNNGELRYTSALDASGAPRVAADATYASEANTPAPGFSLYRFSTGHGSLGCPACHGAAHAESPSSEPADNVQSQKMQGDIGTLVDCEPCHSGQPRTVDGGPHGMHPVGQTWISRHPGVAESRGSAACRDCHGADDRGTDLSRVLVARTMSARGMGPGNYWRGFRIGCYTCHRGPRSEHANPNRPTIVSNATATATAGLPATVSLEGLDPEGNPIVFRIIDQPTHGRAGCDGSTATYVPDATFSGQDSFTFAAWDGSTDSNLGTVLVNVAAAPPTPGSDTCTGDCSDDGIVTVDELVGGVAVALGLRSMAECPAFDRNNDGVVTVDELIQAVNAALQGCPSGSNPTPTAPVPTPTATPPTGPSPTATNGGNPDATLAFIQASIFTPTCATEFCHSRSTRAGGLVLEDGVSRSNLVGAAATNAAAAQSGMLRVAPGRPDLSFLVIKLGIPAPEHGSRMPIGKAPLSATEIQLIRDWITRGAP